MNNITTLHSYRCDLNLGPCEAELHKPLMHQDALADTFRVAVRRGNKAVDLFGTTVYGYLYFSSTKQTLPLTGSVDGHYASITLTDDCYALPGWCSLVIQLLQGEVRHTVLKLNFSVTRTGSENVVLPNSIGPSLPEMLDKIAAMEEATAAAQKAAASVDAATQELHKELDALEQDRTSGALKGEPGEPGFSPLIDVVKVGPVTTLYITDINYPKSIDINDGAPGYTPIKGVDYWTAADQEAIVQQVIAALGMPVFGRVDAENNIILTGELADGTYMIKYEDAEGNLTEIGSFGVGAVGTEIPLTWGKGKLDTSDGTINTSDTTYAYSDAIAVNSDKTYTLHITDCAVSLKVCYYSASGAFISATSDNLWTNTSGILGSTTLTLPIVDGAASMRLRCYLNWVDGVDSYANLQAGTKLIEGDV